VLEDPILQAADTSRAAPLTAKTEGTAVLPWAITLVADRVLSPDLGGHSGLGEGLRTLRDNKTVRRLEPLTASHEISLQLRIQDHRIEGSAWTQGRHYRLVGIRDENHPTAHRAPPTEPHDPAG
jgi:hypothetical protein